MRSDDLDSRARDLKARLEKHLERETVEHRDFREQTHRARTFRLESHGRFMFLAAGIVGIVIPLLAREETLADARFLMWASVVFVVSIAVSAVGQFVDGRLYKRLVSAFSKSVAASRVRNTMAELTAVIGDPPGSVKEFTQKFAKESGEADAALQAFETAQSRHSRTGTTVVRFFTAYSFLPFRSWLLEFCHRHRKICRRRNPTSRRFVDADTPSQ